jgi:hypothetical protein
MRDTKTQDFFPKFGHPDKEEGPDISGQSLWNPARGPDMSGLIGVFSGMVDF